jgi:hypothetical protein
LFLVTTARFKALVERCGRPQVHLSWAPPAKDKVLQEAAASNRLLTVQQESRGGKKDYGQVGLHSGKLVQYLIFPKSLRSFLGRKIIGIDYDALASQTRVSAPGNGPPLRKRTAQAPRTGRKREPVRGKIAAFETAERPPTAPPVEMPVTKLRKKRAKTDPPRWREDVSDAVALIRAGQIRGGLDRLESLLAAQRGR